MSPGSPQTVTYTFAGPVNSLEFVSLTVETTVRLDAVATPGPVNDILVGPSSGTFSPPPGSTPILQGPAQLSFELLDVSTAQPTTTVLTSSLNPSAFGQAVTFTATVTAGATRSPPAR